MILECGCPQEYADICTVCCRLPMSCFLRVCRLLLMSYWLLMFDEGQDGTVRAVV